MQTAFSIGEKIVYPIHGTGRIEDICIQMIEAQPQFCYRIVLEGQPQGEVFVPVACDKALGLRYALQAAQVPEVLQQMQQAATQPVQRGQETQHYIWCKARLRQGDALGLAEVWRFLHDLEQVEIITNPQLRHLRDHVYKQLPAEMAAALHRTRAVTQRLLRTALSSPQPIVLP